MNNLAVMTSGGDSPGMNAALRAVVRSAAHHGVQVHGIQQGYQGLIEDDLRPLGPRDVSGIINRGGTILRSARCPEFHGEEARARAAANLRKRGIDGLVAIGGDGTYRGAQLLHAEHGIRCIGVPGTIDNDIGGTDYTIGFDTALNTAMDVIDRLRDTADSHDRIFFVEVMGRDSGYLAMIVGIAGGAEEILVPETPTDIGALVNTLVEGRARGKHSSIVVVAEGDEAGNALEIAELVRAQGEFTNSRVVVIGHMQRGGSPSAFDRVLASRLGVAAVEALLRGETGKMAGIRGGKVELCPLEEAWLNRNRFCAEMLDLVHALST